MSPIDVEMDYQILVGLCIMVINADYFSSEDIDC